MNPTENGILLQIKVQPRAPKTEITGVVGDMLKIRVKAPPVKGEANRELQEFLGRLFKCGTEKVKIVRGTTSKTKVVKIEGVTPGEAVRLIEGV
jgi:uncharacterized protein (TIGR00251 family)